MSGFGIIGGTGLDQLEGLEVTGEHQIATPFGQPSRAIQEGRFNNQTVFFLHRHGSPAAVPPHLVNYRANVWALHCLGVDRIVGINAVGGITPAMRPGRLLIPDQLIDYTWGRDHTFDNGDSGSLLHVDFTEPYDRTLRMALVNAAQMANITHESTGVHGVTQGPRLETAAEVQRMARDGCDVVGMTGMPEAALARELDIAYACVCMVVNPAAGLGNLPLTLDMMRSILEQEAFVVRALLVALLDQA
jgi:5'-methylthioinosine phosphorylase